MLIVCLEGTVRARVFVVRHRIRNRRASGSAQSIQGLKGRVVPNSMQDSAAPDQ